MQNNLKELEIEANKLITTYCPDYSLAWMNKKRTLGTCCYSTKTISLSKFHAQNQDKSVMVNTILHEIAHAVAGAGTGHGPKWKAACRKVGATPKRCADVDVTGHSWELHCSCRVHKRFRKPKASIVKYAVCSKCKSGLKLKKVSK